MAEKVTAGPITSANGVREAVCIHTKKIFSSCKDKDCIEDLTFYPTATAQSVIDASQSIRGGRVELLHVGVDVEPVSFNRGFFTVDMRFYYRVILQAVMIAGVLLAIHYNGAKLLGYRNVCVLVCAPIQLCRSHCADGRNL